MCKYVSSADGLCSAVGAKKVGFCTLHPITLLSAFTGVKTAGYWVRHSEFMAHQSEVATVRAAMTTDITAMAATVTGDVPCTLACVTWS